jgi:hypothetical protein
MNISVKRCRSVAAAIVTACLTGAAWADPDSGQPADSATSQCAAGSAPTRTGTPLHGDALMSVVIASIQPAELSAAASTPWCLETSAQAGVQQVQIWHDPGQPATTRLTVGIASFEVRAFRETLPPALAKDTPAATIYEVVRIQGDSLRIVGFFDGPPPLDALLSLFTHDRYAIDADIDLKTHKVTIFRPY